jgi:hypothetical protein
MRKKMENKCEKRMTKTADPWLACFVARRSRVFQIFSIPAMIQEFLSFSLGDGCVRHVVEEDGCGGADFLLVRMRTHQ